MSVDKRKYITTSESESQFQFMVYGWVTYLYFFLGTSITSNMPASSCNMGHVAELYKHIAGSYGYIARNVAAFWVMLSGHTLPGNVACLAL